MLLQKVCGKMRIQGKLDNKAENVAVWQVGCLLTLYTTPSRLAVRVKEKKRDNM